MHLNIQDADDQSVHAITKDHYLGWAEEVDRENARCLLQDFYVCGFDVSCVFHQIVKPANAIETPSQSSFHFISEFLFLSFFFFFFTCKQP